MTHVTTAFPKNMKIFRVMWLTSVKDRWNSTVYIVKKYKLADDYVFRIILAELETDFILGSSQF